MDNEELMLLWSVRPDALCLDNLIRAMAVCGRRMAELTEELNARRVAKQARQPLGEADNE